ncbi:hypothetical protein EDD11_006886 [Mortierella claussenii]|nr:hypothetical protein EDD11_006886 [Mortierella claussenii]
MSPAAEEEDREEAVFILFNSNDLSRPTTAREYSTDSGFDERSLVAKPTGASIAAAVGNTAAANSSLPASEHDDENMVHMPLLQLSLDQGHTAVPPSLTTHSVFHQNIVLDN